MKKFLNLNSPEYNECDKFWENERFWADGFWSRDEDKFPGHENLRKMYKSFYYVTQEQGYSKLKKFEIARTFYSRGVDYEDKKASIKGRAFKKIM